MGCNGSKAGDQRIAHASLLDSLRVRAIEQSATEREEASTTASREASQEVPVGAQEDFEKTMQAHHATGWVRATDLEKQMEATPDDELRERIKAALESTLASGELSLAMAAVGEAPNAGKLHLKYGPRRELNPAIQRIASSLVASVDALLEAPVEPMVEAANVTKPSLKRHWTMKSGSLWNRVSRAVPPPMLGGC